MKPFDDLKCRKSVIIFKKSVAPFLQFQPPMESSKLKISHPAYGSEDLEEAFRLRYEAYCDTYGEDQVFADHFSKKIIEPYDKYGHNVNIRLQGILVATFRLSKWSQLPSSLFNKDFNTPTYFAKVGISMPKAISPEFVSSGAKFCMISKENQIKSFGQELSWLSAGVCEIFIKEVIGLGVELHCGTFKKSLRPRFEKSYGLRFLNRDFPATFDRRDGVTSQLGYFLPFDYDFFERSQFPFMAYVPQDLYKSLRARLIEKNLENHLLGEMASSAG